jgi:hypothetical protein
MEKINNFTYDEFMSLKYSKPVIAVDLANVSDYCEYMMRLVLINREKRFRALNKRTSIQYQNGMLTYRDVKTEQLRHYIKYGTEEEDFETMKMNIFYQHYDKIQEDIRAQRVLDQALKPILIKKFNKDLKVISVRTYDYPAHWRARGYKMDRIALEISKTRIVNWYRKKCHSKI